MSFDASGAAVSRERRRWVVTMAVIPAFSSVAARSSARRCPATVSPGSSTGTLALSAWRTIKTVGRSAAGCVDAPLINTKENATATKTGNFIRTGAPLVGHLVEGNGALLSKQCPTRFHFTRRQTVSALPPETPEAASVVFNSSPETENCTRCSRPAANGLRPPSFFLISVLPASSTDHSPNWATTPLAAEASSSVDALARDVPVHFFGRSGSTIIIAYRPFALRNNVPFGLGLKIDFLEPSAAMASYETRDQVPVACSLRLPCAKPFAAANAKLTTRIGIKRNRSLFIQVLP